jgi:hypothetical protein
MGKLLKVLEQLKEVEKKEEEKIQIEEVKQKEKEAKQKEKEIKQKEKEEEKKQIEEAKQKEKEIKQKEKEEIKQKEKQAKEEEKKQKEEAKQKEKQAKEEEKKQKEEAKQKEKEDKEAEIKREKQLKELEREQNKLNREKEQQKIKDLSDHQYIKMKKEIEEKWFIIKDLGQFALYDKERNKFIIHNEQSTKLNMSAHTLDVMTLHGIQQKPFFDRWIRDETRREYDAITFDPEMKNKNDFNTFTGFKYDKIKNPKKSTKEIHNFLDHLFEPKYKKYVLEWLAFILQKKAKTNVCIVLYSHSHGVGKNSFIELIRKIMDQKYISKLENIDEMASQFNSFCESKLLIYGDEILAKTKDLYTSLKNNITRSQVKINKKGIDAYEMANFVNFLFTTNSRIPFLMEKNDRRMSMIQTTENILSEEQTQKFYKALEDEEIMISFFHELMDLDIPEQIKCLDTPLKREIQNIYLPSPIKFLYKNYSRLEGSKFSINELFEKIKEFEKSNFYTEIKSTQQMALALKEVADFTYKNNDKRGYKFNGLENILKNYNSELFNDYQKDDCEDSE